MNSASAIVIGAGFGGLSAALHLAEAGRDVVLFEALGYPGGCASTFERFGHRYEAGATMFAGFGPGGPMTRLLERFDVDVPVHLLDPVLDFRSPDLALTIGSDREAFVEALCEVPGAPVQGIRAFFDELVRVADPLWSLFAHPELLPPLSGRALWGHLKRAPGYLPLVAGVGRPLSSRLQAHGIDGFVPLVRWLDAACQITVQATADQAEAPVAMAAVDYFWRGCAGIDGGIGVLAEAMVRAIEQRGGQVRLADRVKRIERVGDRWRVHGRRGAVEAPVLVANTLPQDVDALMGVARDDRLVRSVRGSWGAAMLYLQVEDVGLDPGPVHLQAYDGGATEGALVLVSIAPAAGGTRSATVSTHLPVGPDLPERVERVHERMRATLASRVPELRIAAEMTGSPRTFARFTRREQGRVGGVPRTSGLHNYLRLGPQERAPGLWLVGDSVFPGQSVLAVTLAGNRVARAILG